LFCSDFRISESRNAYTSLHRYLYTLTHAVGRVGKQDRMVDASMFHIDSYVDDYFFLIFYILVCSFVRFLNYGYDSRKHTRGKRVTHGTRESHTETFFVVIFLGAICQNVLQTYIGLLVRIVTTAQALTNERKESDKSRVEK
jgi:hypothetical protein